MNNQNQSQVLYWAQVRDRAQALLGRMCANRAWMRAQRKGDWHTQKLLRIDNVYQKACRALVYYQNQL